MIRNWSTVCPTCHAKVNHPCRSPRVESSELVNGLRFTGEPRRVHKARLRAVRVTSTLDSYNEGDIDT